MVKWKPRKVSIVGAGFVGATFAFALAQSGLADEIALIDKNKNLAEGHVLDMNHGLFYLPNVTIRAGEVEDYTDSHVIVITAGSGQKPGESRLNLLQRNAAIMESIVDEIKSTGSNAVIVVVSNPVDVLTWVAQQRADWPAGRVIGSGTVLDSARLRYLISKHCNINVHNVHAYVLGEHGDSEFAAWSMTHLAGMNMDDYCQICGRCGEWDQKRIQIEEEVRNSAYHIIDYKGSTYFGVGMALVRIMRSILRNEHSVLTVSSVLNGEFGLKDVSIGVPTLITDKGGTQVINAELNEEEMKKLHASAVILQDAIRSLKG